MPHAQFRIIKKKGGRTRRRGGQSGGTNSVRHGFYCLIDESLLDQRSKYAKFRTKVRSGIVADMGGPEGISTKQWILIELIVDKAARCTQAQADQVDGNSKLSSEHFLALANSLRLDLLALGLAKRAQDVPNLRDYLASKSRQPA